METPILDLHGLQHHEVANVVARFVEDWLGRGLFVDIITGNSPPMTNEVLKVVNQYGLDYMVGLPAHPGRVRVVMYDEYN